jgi:hypothetical protein
MDRFQLPAPQFSRKLLHASNLGPDQIKIPVARLDQFHGQFSAVIR